MGKASRRKAEQRKKGVIKVRPGRLTKKKIQRNINTYLASNPLSYHQQVNRDPNGGNMVRRKAEAPPPPPPVAEPPGLEVAVMVNSFRASDGSVQAASVAGRLQGNIERLKESLLGCNWKGKDWEVTGSNVIARYVEIVDGKSKSALGLPRGAMDRIHDFLKSEGLVAFANGKWGLVA